MSFDDFVLEVISPPPDRAKIGSQLAILSDLQDRVLVDPLFAYTNQPAFLSFLTDRLDFSVALPQKNVSPPVDAPLSAPVVAQLRAARAAEFACYKSLSVAGGYLGRSA